MTDINLETNVDQNTHGIVFIEDFYDSKNDIRYSKGERGHLFIGDT